jgi:hypothetical protein
MRDSGSASRALSVPVLNNGRSAKSTETVNDRLLHFMAQPPKVKKNGEFGVTAQFVIEVQPLFIRNSFQQFFACVPSYQPKSLLFKPKWIWNKIPDVIRDTIYKQTLVEPAAMSALCHERKSAAYSITSSARASSVWGTSRPSALAVFKLMTNSNLFGACTGRSPGRAPFKI